MTSKLVQGFWRGGSAKIGLSYWLLTQSIVLPCIRVISKMISINGVYVNIPVTCGGKMFVSPVFVTKFQEEVLGGTRIFKNTVYDRYKRASVPKSHSIHPVIFHTIPARDRRTDRGTHNNSIHHTSIVLFCSVL